MGEYDKLHLDAIDYKINDNKLKVETEFVCPVCGKDVKSKIKKEYTEEFNGQETFVLSCCDLNITLYFAVFDPLGTPEVSFSITPLPQE